MRPGLIATKKNVVGKYWRRYIVDECPDEKWERIRRERIANIMMGVVALEAARQWEIENAKLSFSK